MADKGGEETERERLERNLDQLLQGLRVALPGVQVLFAFMLTVPFSSGFPSLSTFERDLYFVVLALTALSAALLIAPSVYHRLLFREGLKRQLVIHSNRVVIVGLSVLAVAMTGAISLIAQLVFGNGAAMAAGAVAAATFGVVWYLVPALIRRGAAD
jgi:Family of unknown function (DUF6328)